MELTTTIKLNALDFVSNIDTRKDLLLVAIATKILLGYNLPPNWSKKLQNIPYEYGVNGCTKIELGFCEDEKTDDFPTRIELHYFYGEYFSYDIFLNTHQLITESDLEEILTDMTNDVYLF